DSDHDGRWAVGRGRHRRHGFGFGGRPGFGGGDMVRVGRMLATGDLRLIALALIAEQPRHGYEIIKVLEEKTAGWYSPSPGIVYPTLTFLEEAGYVMAQAEGAKKLYTITDEGRAYLDQNRDFVDAVLERLKKIGGKIARMRRRLGRDDDGEEDERRGLPTLVRAALENLREVAGERLANDADTEAKLVEILARAALEMKKA
ncbi:MAG TPA: PadR family transcriptional regulator, partial [Xanthobacteraceae bacterium]